MRSNFKTPTSYPLLAVLVGFLILSGPQLRAELIDNRAGKSWDVAVTYTSDLWRNTKGGIERDSAYLDSLSLTLDWQSPSNGLHSHLHVIHNNGKSLSEKVGDTHIVSNIEADRGTRFLEGWIEYGSVTNRDRSIKAGIYDLNSEFDASEVSSALINSTFGSGIDIAQSGVVGPSIFPYTGLALRGCWRINDSWLLKGAVIDGIPIDEDHPRRVTSLKLSSKEGALAIAELEHRVDKIRTVIGHWRYSARFDKLDVLAGGEGNSRRNVGTYMFIEGPVKQSGDRRLLVMVRLGAANPQLNAIGSTAQAALVFERPFLNRDGEYLALGFAQARFGGPVRRLSFLAGEKRPTRESVIELTWRLPLSRRIFLQPDLQYVINPGSDQDTQDALAVGLRVEVGLLPDLQ
ncbi:MAG: carbohydrate porin [Gammaproteobacteria bacterium]|nr:carbohydrate porin [Gammaproteobacteria bacterium]